MASQSYIANSKLTWATSWDPTWKRKLLKIKTIHRRQRPINVKLKTHTFWKPNFFNVILFKLVKNLKVYIRILTKVE
jgi:hypothetical protein